MVNHSILGNHILYFSALVQSLIGTLHRCGQEGQRETDTMDTFVDSSWYFLRFLDVNNEEQPFSFKLQETFMPVDLYVGGKEHGK